MSIPASRWLKIRTRYPGRYGEANAAHSGRSQNPAAAGGGPVTAGQAVGLLLAITKSA